MTPVLMDLPSRFCSDFIINASFGKWRCAQPLDRCNYAVEQSTTDCNFCELEGDYTGVTHTPCTIFAQPSLQAGQRPIGYLLGKVCALREDTEIVGQRVKLKSNFVLRHANARQSRPVDRLLAFLDVLLCGATLIVKTYDPVRLHRKVTDDETNAGKKRARVPFDFGDDTGGACPMMRPDTRSHRRCASRLLVNVPPGA